MVGYAVIEPGDVYCYSCRARISQECKRYPWDELNKAYHEIREEDAKRISEFIKDVVFEGKGEWVSIESDLIRGCYRYELRKGGKTIASIYARNLTMNGIDWTYAGYSLGHHTSDGSLQDVKDSIAKYLADVSNCLVPVICR